MMRPFRRVIGCLAVASLLVVFAPSMVWAQGSVTVRKRWRQVENQKPRAPADNTLWGWWFETRGAHDWVYRLDLTCVCDDATSSLLDAVPLEDGATTMVWTADIVQVCTSPTLGLMTAAWDFELRNDYGADLLEYDDTHYGHDRMSTAPQCLQLRYEPSVVGSLWVSAENTTGTFVLSLFYYSER